MITTAMFTAAMCYRAKKENFSEMCRIWQDEVFLSAPKIPGLISMQLLTEKVKPDQTMGSQSLQQAFAVGIWDSLHDAENYMKTGVFKRLLERLDGVMETLPESKPWDAACYYSRELHFAKKD
ncbi:MAG: hypothetical protein HQ557_00570 [Bacteroidetes bacterium]|nr:hypothetical protein [Bacteroidota bacterium]